MDGCTTYRLSYWPHCGEKPPEPFVLPENENLLNGGCCFDDNTTYRLSYFGCGGDKPPDPVRQLGNIIFSPCPLSHDTVNRVSVFARNRAFTVNSIRGWHTKSGRRSHCRVHYATITRDNFLQLPNNRCVASQIDSSVIFLSSRNPIVTK